LIQRQVGGNLAEILQNIAHTIRERVRIKQEVRTLTAQGRLSGIIISLLPFALAVFLFFSNPDYIMVLFRHPVGLFMLGLGLAAQIIGIILIRRIIRIEV
jgi:tight adherence protein B